MLGMGTAAQQPVGTGGGDVDEDKDRLLPSQRIGKKIGIVVINLLEFVAGFKHGPRVCPPAANPMVFWVLPAPTVLPGRETW